MDKKVIRVLDDIIDNFDFDKVKVVMDNLDWKWCGMKRADIQTGEWELKVESDVPTLDEIKQLAANLLWDLANDPENTFCATGGFRAEKDFSDPNSPWMRLSFEVTDWDVEFGEIETASDEDDYLE